MATHAHDAMTAHTFDAAGWFAAWSDQGGIAMLIDNRLWVGRICPLDRGAAQALNGLRTHLHTPGAANALAGLLRANMEGVA